MIKKGDTGENNKALRIVKGAACAVISLIAATALGYLFRYAGFPETNIVLLYILAVLVTASLVKGYVFGILTSVAATLAFNYFFTSPYHSLDVDDPSYMITFAIMTIASMVTSALTSRAGNNAATAMAREKETHVLYELTSHLTEAKDVHQVAEITVGAVSSLLNCQAGCVCFNENNEAEQSFVQQAENGRLVKRHLENAKEFGKSIEKLCRPVQPGDEFYDYPVYGDKDILGVLRIPKEAAENFTEAQKRFLHSMIECTALAMDRLRSFKKQMKSQQEIVQERYRGNLLRAISHDLRTPLSGIMGTSEMIMNMTDKEDARYDMALGISKDAHWLHALVENILSLTKLQEGRMILRRQPEAVEEIIEGALAQMHSRAPEFEIKVVLPDELLMVPMDGKLIMQVLINLLDNAVKHTGEDGEVKVTVTKDGFSRCAVFKVSDTGEGIAPEDLPNIFKTFYTSQIKSADARKGIGLGLTICESIVKAHGGHIEARNRTDGPGAEFLFTLPLTADKEASDEPVS